MPEETVVESPGKGKVVAQLSQSEIAAAAVIGAAREEAHQVTQEMIGMLHRVLESRRGAIQDQEKKLWASLYAKYGLDPDRAYALDTTTGNVVDITAEPA
jgi:hypothetical protein